ncbi:MAG: heme exporter protein CcmB [Bacteroidetes bacterium]|nr:heme exporter protein CcmB [Bacteroidota bacterium]
MPYFCTTFFHINSDCIQRKLSHIIALLKKDLLLEIRQQYSFYGVLLYVAATIFVLYLAMGMGQGQPDSSTWNGLFWTIQLFVCVNAVAKSFLAESRGRMLYFYSIAGARDFILAKLCFNVLLMMVMSLVSWLLFAVFLGNPVINPFKFLGINLLGGMGLSLVFTFLSAIAARAAQNAALMAIMGFPILMPQLMLLIKISGIVFSDVIQAGLGQIVGLLAGLDVLVVILAIILFPYLWKD